MEFPSHVIIWAAAAFLVIFVLQILLAAIYRSESEDKFIIFLYAIMPFCIFLVALPFGFFGWATLTEGILTYLLYFVISSSWVASYPAVYAVCPTLIISYVIDRNQKKGTAKKELRDLLALKQNSVDRIEDAVHDNFIKKSDDAVHLTGTGKTFLAFFRTYRCILGRDLETL